MPVQSAARGRRVRAQPILRELLRGDGLRSLRGSSHGRYRQFSAVCRSAEHLIRECEHHQYQQSRNQRHATLCSGDRRAVVREQFMGSYLIHDAMTRVK